MPSSPPLKKVNHITWWNGKRYAVLACEHKVEIGLKDAMPAELHCPTCDPLEPA